MQDHVKPHNPVAPSIVARWLRSMMEKAACIRQFTNLTILTGTYAIDIILRVHYANLLLIISMRYAYADFKHALCAAEAAHGIAGCGTKE